MRRPGPVLGAALLVAGAVLAGGCGSSAGAQYVTRSGAELRVGDQPFRFVGVNVYDAAATDAYSCEPRARLTVAQLRRTLADAHERAGATVVRFWAYQTYTSGGTDFTGVDQVLSAARAAGMRALPVLEDGPGNCTTGPDGARKDQVEDGTWYATGYRTPYGSARLSLRDYAALMARHYRDDPTVLAWMLMNEAETSARDARGRSVLVGFAQDLAGVVHAADPHHLVTLGNQGNGAPGASGPDFRAVYGLPGLDLAEVHDWASHGSDTTPLPGATDRTGRVLPAAGSSTCRATDAPIACSFALAAALGKPLVVGEAGIRATDDAGRQRRARLLGAKIDADLAAGADGYLVWHLTRTPTDGYDLVSGSDDPLFGVLHRAAAQLH